jgi:hypothetical protein
MAKATIYLTNGLEVKKAPVGFSWTVFFWGGWPCLFRQDWVWAILLLLACIFTYGIAGIVCAFFYNKVYIKSLIEKGYWIHDSNQVSDTELKQYLSYLELPKAPK